MPQIYNEELRNERDCGTLEFWARRTYSGILYHKFYRRLHTGNPYYVPEVVKLLDKFLEGRNAKVFEWGSGISTIWYAKRVESLIAIEHNEEWLYRIKNWLETEDLNNVKLKYLPPQGNSFQEYSQIIAEYEDESFDVIAVDGRSRVECAKQAIKKVAIGGYLILDDSHRAKYQPIFDMLTEYEYTQYDFGLLQTTIFRRLQ